jgi:hypothetical protein
VVKRIARRTLLAVLVFAALLYPVYLAVGNWMLRSGVERWLNRRPERFLIQCDSAWTVWPGVVHVRGFRIRGQTPSVQWWGSVDRGTLWVRLWDLQDREFIAGPVQGTGVSFRLRRRADAPRRRRVTQQGLEPAIPGFSNPPARKPETLYPPAPPRRRRDPWHIRLARIQFEDVREIWIEEYHFAGKGRVTSGFDLRLRKSVELDPTRLEVASGDLLLGDRPILATAKGRIEGRIEPFSPAEHRGWDVLRFVSGRAGFQGRVRSLEFLDLHFRKTKWLDIRSGGGPVDVDLRMGRGRILPGSRLVGRPEDVKVGFLDYGAEGSGTIRWQVVAEKGDPEGRLALELAEFRLRREGYGRPHVQGRGLLIEAVSPEPRVGRLFDPLRVAVEMPRAEVPHLAFYNAYLPRQSGFELTSGAGVMTGRFQAASPDWKGTGDLRLTARGIGARFEGKPLRGDLRLHTRLRQVDLEDKRFDISGSQAELTNVRMQGGGPGAWWARAHLDDALLLPGRPVFLRAKIESTLSDVRPVFIFFAPQGRNRLVHWVDDLLDVQGVGATAAFTLGESYVDVADLAVAGGPAQLQGRLRFDDGDRKGVLLASYGRFDVGLELQGAERDWRILRPRKWFAEYPPFE